MLLAFSHMAEMDLILGAMAVLAFNIAFIAALSFFPEEKEKLLSRMIDG